MARRIGILIMALTFIIAFLYVPSGHTEEKDWEKTITLPNGEVVLDMSGEWVSCMEFQGMYSGLKSQRTSYIITQKGNIFSAVTTIEGRYYAKGTEVIKGELCKDGLKTVEMHRPDVGWVPGKSELSENGNKIVLDDGRVIKETLTRR